MAKSKANGPGAGHNSDSSEDEALAKYRDRVAEYMRQQKSIGETIKEICRAASDEGVVTPKALRQLAREHIAEDHDVVKAHLAYMADLRARLAGLTGTPLGDAAVAAADAGASTGAA